ncbi:MAG: Uncharacterised protein [Polaribacter sp. SA4-10]|nr:MAG: Uncharacterised protein [Polaribacter sp. SA4-10]
MYSFGFISYRYSKNRVSETFSFIDKTSFPLLLLSVGMKNKSLVFKILLSVVPKLMLKDALLSLIMYNGSES